MSHVYNEHYAYESRTRGATLLRRALPRARAGQSGLHFAGCLAAALCLLLGSMIAQDAQGQNPGVNAVPLGDSFVFFVNAPNPNLLRNGDMTVVNDPEGGDNKVLQLNPGDHTYARFFFADGHTEGAPRDMTANRDAGNVISFRILVNTGNPQTDENLATKAEQYRLSIQFEDYGPDDNNGANVIYNYPFRLRWSIPDSMRDGKWRDVSLTLPPATWATLEAAKTANTITDLEKRWIYAGSWAGMDPGGIGLDLEGPLTNQNRPLWKEFEWDKIESVGIQWDYVGGDKAPIYLDDVYIGPAGQDLSNLQQPPPAVTGVNFEADGNWHNISWTHNADHTDIASYKVYASHSPITDLKAQSVAHIATVGGELTANGGEHTVRAPGELPHPSVGSVIYYAVTSLESVIGLENRDISGSSGSLKATYSPAIVQLTARQAAAIKANIASGTVSGAGFPATAKPFTINEAHSVRTVGTDPAQLTGDSDLSASVWVGYSDANEIYIYAEVTDDDIELAPTTRVPAETWQDDSIELVWGNYDVRDAGGSIIGGSPHDDGERGVRSVGSSENRKRGNYPDYHVFISAHGTETAATVRNASVLAGGGPDKVDAGSGAYAPMTGGYKILQVLPVAEFKDALDSAPAFPGANGIRYSPMSITLNDKRPGAGEPWIVRDAQITWSLRAWENGDNINRKPWQWQTVAMVGRNVPDTPQTTITENPGGTKLLRVGGGDLFVNLDAEITEFGNADWTIHHYAIGDGAAVNDPGASFIAGSQAQVALDDRDILQITPISAGKFKIAFQPADATGDEKLRPIQFEIMSSDAPRLQVASVTTGAKYNAQANAYAETIALTISEKTSEELELYDRFTDPDEVTLDYGIFVGKPDVVTAVQDGSKLRLSLAEGAKGGDATDVWVVATDSGGEYARLRIGVNVASATKPYLANKLEDIVMREASGKDGERVVHLFGTFADGNGDALSHEVTVSDETTAKIGANPTVFVTSYMRTEVDASNVTPSGSEIKIRSLKPGGDATDVWVVATDSGGEYARLRIGVNVASATKPYLANKLEDIVMREASGKDGERVVHLFGTFADGNGDALSHEVTVSDETTAKIGANPTVFVTSYMRTEVDASNVTPSGSEIKIRSLKPGGTTFTVTAKDPGGQSASDTFRLTVVSATSPIVKTKIPDQTISAEGDPLKINLNDIDAKKDGDQPAFETSDGSRMTYSANSKDVKIARAGARGNELTITPVWSAETRTTEVTVTARNTKGEVWPQTFMVTVQGASKPTINPRVQPILAAGITLDYGDKPWVQDLKNVQNPLDPKDPLGPLFIDPNADPGDLLPGGFKLVMDTSDVVTAHRYDNLSEPNDVYTSAGRITLDPATGILTFVPTAANTLRVTIHATDRELNKISASMTITVSEVTSAEGEELPTEVSLSQNYPNPFNPQTTIEYALPQAGDVSLLVYDMLGREVATLIEGPQAAGRHAVNFDANGLPNGTYVYRLVAPNKTITRTMVLVK